MVGWHWQLACQCRVVLTQQYFTELSHTFEHSHGMASIPWHPCESRLNGIDARTVDVDLEARYEFLEKIGAGSFATVYRARDRELGREVAIKEVHQQYLDQGGQLDRYWQEAQLLASLQHPNIVTIYDVYRERGWLILELMQANLADRMAGRQMDLRALRSTLAHALRALKYLHGRGIIHGDIKLSNLMIDHRRRVKLGDFGLARRVSDEEGSLLKGTTRYMAPEVVSPEFGDIGPASDLYSLGFCAYELLCGPNFESLFPGLSAFGRNKQAAWMMWHAAADRRLPPIHKVLEGVPDDIARVIERLIEKDQSQRYASADEALSDLKVDLKLVKSGTADDEVRDDDDPARRKRLLIAGGAFAASLIMCLVLLFLPGGSTETKEPKSFVRLVSEVHADENRLKVEDLDRSFAQNLALGETPRIFLVNTGRNITIDELQPGDQIEVERATDEAGRRVLKIRAARPVPNRGRIKSIDRQARTVVVGVEDGESRDDLKLQVPQRAQIAVNGELSELRQLEEGDPVELTHVANVEERDERILVRLSVQRLTSGDGYVTAVDAVDRRLTVNTGRGQMADAKMLPVAEDARIRLGEQELKLEDLEANDRIRFRYDIVIREIDVTRGERVAGVVREVRVGPRELRVGTADAGEIVFTVADDAEVTIHHAGPVFEPLRKSAGDDMTRADLAALRATDMVDITAGGKSGDERRPALAVTARRPPRHDRRAIVIGVDAYEDQSLSRLPHAVDDAQLVRDALVIRYACDPGFLKLLADRPRDELQPQIEEALRQVNRQTQVIVYVNCHAYLGDDGRPYLAGRRFDWDRTAETGLALDWLLERLEACDAADKLLLLDVCHSGTGGDLKTQPSSEELLGRARAPLRTTAVIASCAEGERGLVWPEKKHGLFGWFVAQGFGGEADSNRDLSIAPAELFGYLKTRMGQTDIGGRRQTPVLVGGSRDKGQASRVRTRENSNDEIRMSKE
ncbi:MAG: serine/threonine protein kinase [Planctomycetes bacterium]|nr:serine/threonine protein kinase [Planctomycetota bacterium]